MVLALGKQWRRVDIVPTNEPSSHHSQLTSRLSRPQSHTRTTNRLNANITVRFLVSVGCKVRHGVVRSILSPVDIPSPSQVAQSRFDPYPPGTSVRDSMCRKASKNGKHASAGSVYRCRCRETSFLSSVLQGLAVLTYQPITLNAGSHAGSGGGKVGPVSTTILRVRSGNNTKPLCHRHPHANCMSKSGSLFSSKYYAYAAVPPVPSYYPCHTYFPCQESPKGENAPLLL